MFGSEENLNPHDVYLFHRPEVSNVYSQSIQDYCDYVMDTMAYNMLSQMVFDADFSYYEDNVDLVKTIETNVNELIQALADTDTEYYNTLLADSGNREQTLGEAIYNHLFSFHNTFLIHLPTIFNMAKMRHTTYVDFNLSYDVDKMVLRMRRGLYGNVR